MGEAEPRHPPPSVAGSEPILPTTPLENCPIRVSLGALGRKWTLLVLRDVAFFPGSTFGTIRKNNPGLGNRILSIRLKQLLREGLIERRDSNGGSPSSGYFLTERGRAILPVLTALIQYGSRYHADEVFPDHRPRALEEVFPDQRRYLVGDLAGYVEGDPARGRLSSPGSGARARSRNGA